MRHPGHRARRCSRESASERAQREEQSADFDKKKAKKVKTYPMLAARALLLGVRAAGALDSPAACSRVTSGGSLAVWRAFTRGVFSASSPSSSSTGGRRSRRLLDDLLSLKNTNANNEQQQQQRSAGLAALIAGGTVAAAAGAFYVVSSVKESKKKKSNEASPEEEEKASSAAAAVPSPPTVAVPCPSTTTTITTAASSSPCAQPGAAPDAAPVDRAALLADLRAWLEAAGADVSDVDIRPCEGNSAGVGVFATARRRRRGSGDSGDRGALATAGAVASALARRLLPFGAPSTSGGKGGGTANANDSSSTIDNTITSSSSPPTVVLASFPLSLAVTPAAALADEATGRHYARLLASRQLADERALVMLFLAVERARGRSSRWAQWIAALPRDFSTPLHFTEEQLDLLKGTTLGKAAASLRARLAAAWGRLAPAAAEVAAAAGVAAPPTLEDFKWAYSTFWSRGMAVPWPVVVTAPAGAGVGAAAGGTVGGSAAAAAETAPSVAVEVVECILPGLDFCNHAPGAAVRWTLWGAGAGGEKEKVEEKEKEARASSSPSPSSTSSLSIPDRVALVAPLSAAPGPGDELLIDYGDKSQEELLLLYGFAHARSSAATEGRVPGVLMVPCPLPAAAPPPPIEDGSGGGGKSGKGSSSRGDIAASASASAPSSLHPQTLGGWDPDLEDRLELLRRRGLAPQVFLPVSGPSDGDGEGEGAKASSATSRPLLKRLLWPFGSSSPDSSSPSTKTPASFLPPGVWDTLEAFVLEPEFVRAALAHPDAVTPPRGGGGGGGGSGGDEKNPTSSSSSSSSSSVESAGLRMAVLTTLARLLEGTVLTLEGPGGTGPLEADVAWLEGKEGEEEGGGEDSSSASASASSTSSDAAIRRACVEYRATQKAAARRWLARARRAVDEQVAELEALMEGGKGREGQGEGE